MKPWQRALEHYRTHNGVFMWTPNGIYCKCGRYVPFGILPDPHKCLKFANTYGTVFNQLEIARTLNQITRRFERYKRLAVLAIELNKFKSAAKLAESADETRDLYRDLLAGNVRYFHVRGASHATRD